MKRMAVLLSFALLWSLAAGSANSAPTQTPALAAPAIASIHMGTTSVHVTPTLPFGEPTTLEIEVHNLTTGEIISSGWEVGLYERGCWQFNLLPEHTYCFQARSRDATGLISPWGLAKCANSGSLYYLQQDLPINDQYVTHEISLPDLDGDGRLDFFGAVSDDGDDPTLYARQLDGSFLDVTPPALQELSSGAIFGDWDNDGDADVYQMHRIFLRNDGAPSFTDLSAELVTPLMVPGAIWMGRPPMAWVDLDGDGNLELFVTSASETRALKRSGATGFSLLSGACLNSFNSIQSIDFGDHDLDGDADLCVVDLSGAHFFENDGEGNLRELVLSFSMAGVNAASWGDLDDDGWLDLAISSVSHGVEIAMNVGYGGYVKDSSRLVGDPLLPERNGSSVSTAQGFAWGDVDNDGWLDLLVQRGSETGTVICRNDGSGVLHTPSDCFPELLCGLLLDTDIITGDWDKDGILDVYRPGTAIAYGDSGINAAENHWITLHLEGSSPSNRMAVGTRVTIEINGVRHYRQLWATAQRGSQQSPIVHFGLGEATIVDSLLIDWPSGRHDRHAEVPVDHPVHTTEGSGATGVQTPVALASNMILFPARPNPFNSRTSIAFELARSAAMEATIYDLQGRVVRRLENGTRPEGNHTLSWDGRDARGLRVAGGIYLLKLRSGTFEATQRLVLLR